MSSNKFLIDSASRRAIFVQLFAAGQSKKAESELEAIFDSVLGILASGRPSVQGEIDALLKESFTDLSSNAIDELVKFANNEASFSAKLFRKATTATNITAPKMDATIGMTRMDLNPTTSINMALSQFGASKTRQVNQTIADGFTQGKTNQQLIKDVSELIPLQKRQIGSLVRTATNSTATASRFSTIEASKNLFEGYEWVSTLDGRTSFVCMSRDGQLYPIADSSPKPPAHWSCRSTIIPKVKRQFDLGADIDGDRPSVGSDGAKTVSGNLTYSGFLRDQSKEFQDEVLGPTRAKLFRSGKLTLDKFVDDAGRTLTLEQLEALNPLVF